MSAARAWVQTARPEEQWEAWSADCWGNRLFTTVFLESLRPMPGELSFRPDWSLISDLEEGYTGMMRDGTKRETECTEFLIATHAILNQP
jgi:hypothetical protein